MNIFNTNINITINIIETNIAINAPGIGMMDTLSTNSKRIRTCNESLKNIAEFRRKMNFNNDNLNALIDSMCV